MKKQTKIAVAGAGVSAAGAGAALGGESLLWSIFSSGPGAALTGICEHNAFLAWLGGGSLAAGGGGMAAGSAGPYIRVYKTILQWRRKPTNKCLQPG